MVRPVRNLGNASARNAAREGNEQPANQNAGNVNAPIGGGIGVAAAAVAGAGAVPPEMGQVLGVLAQILERLAPQPAVNPPVGNVPPAGQENVPSYLTVMDHMMKLGTSYFSGGADPIKAVEWRTRLERNFNSVRCPIAYRKDIATHYLAEEADTWWTDVSNRMANPNCTWETFRDLFHAKYFPQEARNKLESEFLDLRQGSMTVRELQVEFDRLKKFGGRDMDDEQAQIRRFMRALDVDLQIGCSIRDYATLSELVEKAALLEARLEEKAKLSNSQVSTQSAPQSKSDQGGGQKKNWGKKNFQGKSSGQNRVCPTCKKMHSGTCRLLSGQCLRCGSKDHRISECPERDRQQDTRSCYNCGEAGHLRPNCPKLMQLAGKRANEQLPPPPKRPAIMPRVYSVSEEYVNEASTSRPITGKSCHLP